MNIKTAAAAVMAALVLSGCGLVSDAQPEDTESEAEKPTTSRRFVGSTKTMSITAGAPDAADDDLGGYTTTALLTGSLENTVSPGEAETAATSSQSTTTVTTTTFEEVTMIISFSTESVTSDPLPEGEEDNSEKTSETTTVTAATEFKADSLYKPDETDKLKKRAKFLVESDTTYLNLRFGPSKKYDVQLRIPDGEYIYGSAIASNPDDENELWVYVVYDGNAGWVMRELLAEIV